MVSVNFKLAILTVLAKWPDRRATVDEVRREVGTIIPSEDQAEQLRRLSALGDIDIFQTGLVSRNEEGFQNGCRFVAAASLESASGPSIEAPGSASLMGANGQREGVDSQASDNGESDHDDQPVQREENQPVLIDAPYGGSASLERVKEAFS